MLASPSIGLDITENLTVQQLQTPKTSDETGNTSGNEHLLLLMYRATRKIISDKYKTKVHKYLPNRFPNVHFCTVVITNTTMSNGALATLPQVKVRSHPRARVTSSKLFRFTTNTFCSPKERASESERERRKRSGHLSSFSEKHSTPFCHRIFPRSFRPSTNDHGSCPCYSMMMTTTTWCSRSHNVDWRNIS